MPGMVAFGRRWSIATDDFTVIGIVDSMFFFGWWCWSLFIYLDFQKNHTCVDVWCIVLQVFLAGCCCLYLLNCILAACFIFFSIQGSVSNAEPRRHVVTLVYLKSVLSSVDLVWAILGSVLIGQRALCLDFSFIVKILTGCFWFMFFVRLEMTWMFYDPRGRKKTSLKKVINSEYFEDPAPAGTARKWRYRLQAVFCWFTMPSQDRALAIKTISQLMAFLVHDLDIVGTDLLAGLKLYRHKCIEEHKAIQEALDKAPSIVSQDGSTVDSFPTKDFLPWMNLKLASRYFTLGMGIFGWPWTLYRNFSCGLCAMWKYLICCFGCRKNFSQIEGDNCCACNLAGLRTTSGFRHEDLVHVSFVNRVYQIPFFVAVDDETSAVVVILRGSMSCSDALTDVAAEFSPINEDTMPADTYCHGGILLAARRIRDKLEQNEILNKALEGRNKYNLIVMGHSLGAGVASILTILLKRTYPDIRCYAFAPPPIFNEAALEATKDHIFTVIFGNDIVPYLNYYNVYETVIRSVGLLNECQLPKYKILIGSFGKKNNPDPSLKVEVNIEEGSKTDSSSEQKINGDKNLNGYTRSNSLPKDPKQAKLFIPGRILHIRYSKFGYRLRICQPQDFHPLKFSPHMIYHHFPQFMETCLKQLGETETVKLKES